MMYNKDKGFTLIEIIITLTLVSVLSTMIFTYFGKALTESVTPIVWLRTSATLQRVVENITADYNVYPKWRSGTVYSATTSYVIPTNFNGFYYQCTAVSGDNKSAMIEPANWPTSGTTITDNNVTWTCAGRLRTIRPLATLQTSIGAEGTDQDNAYGKYHVVRNRFTQFVNNIDQDSDTSGANRILKVTLKNDSGQTLTALLFSD
jgi:prepilin-type N-terminal cleavage/methylation domain-containing protein